MTSQVIGFLQTAPSITRNNIQYYWRVVPGGDPPVQPFYQLEGVEYPFIIGPAGESGTLIRSGAFTPVMAGSSTAGAPEYAARQGYYTRVGNMVMITGYIQLSASHDGTGSILITGLPYAISGNSTTGQIYVNSYTVVSADCTALIGNFIDGATRIEITERKTNGTTVTAGASAVNNIALGGSVFFSGTYATTADF